VKIGLFVPFWPPGAGANGIVTYVAHLMFALRELGHEVILITPFTPSAPEAADVPVVSLLRYAEQRPIWLRAVRRLIPTAFSFYSENWPLVAAVKDLVKQNRIEVLEMEETFGSSFAISELRIVPLVVRLHGPWFLNRRYQDLEREVLERRGIESADAITAPTKSVFESVVSKYGRPSTCATFPNPITVDPAVEKWSLESFEPESLLFVGRFDEIKGGDLVLQAFGELAEVHPNLRLTFVGPDDGVRGSKFADYAKRVLSKMALSRLTYKGSLTVNDVSKLRASHFATICASRYEVFGYTVLEAMSFGCPIVASGVGGIPELIRTGQNGLLFSPGDLRGLISSCERLLSNPTYAARLGEQALHDCREKFNSSKIAPLAVEVYERAIAAFRGGANDR
jgi:glycosyltransferase involved in cell wall biosynthesis